jgi:AraC-like DNA-binding protein
MPNRSTTNSLQALPPGEVRETQPERETIRPESGPRLRSGRKGRIPRNCYTVVRNWVVQAFPRNQAAAVVFCYFLAKFMPAKVKHAKRDRFGKRIMEYEKKTPVTDRNVKFKTKQQEGYAKAKMIGKPVFKTKRAAAFAIHYTKSGLRYRAWRFYSVAWLADQLCMTRWQIGRALKVLQELTPAPFAISMKKFTVYCDPTDMAEYVCQVRDEYHKRLLAQVKQQMQKAKRAMREGGTAKYLPGPDACPALCNLIRDQVTRLYGYDTKRCGSRVSAALLLAKIRGKILYYQKQLGKQYRDFNRTDEQLAADTGLAEDTVMRSRNWLVKQGYLLAEKKQVKNARWPLYHYRLPARKQRKGSEQNVS